jgi:hypothetical protein
MDYRFRGNDVIFERARPGVFPPLLQSGISIMDSCPANNILSIAPEGNVHSAPISHFGTYVQI